jgi:hypothetical protein
MRREKTSADRSRRPQLVGAFGEKVVEAELLRRSWSTANANMGVEHNLSTIRPHGLDSWNTLDCHK